MAWIESHTTLARHPKTLRLAKLLNVAVPTAIGHLHLLWWWALEYAPDGSLAAFSAEEIALACMWDGDAAQLRTSLQKSGFVERSQIHDWQDYAGKLLDRRAANRERMRSERAQHVRSTDDDSDDARAKHVQRTRRARATHRAPHVQSDRTVPNQTQPTSSADAEGGAGLDVPEALQAFHDTFAGVRGYAPTPAFFAKVATKYGQLDLEEEAIKIRAWLAGHRKRDCSTAFILTWLKRCAEEAAADPIAPLPSRNGAHRNGHATVDDDDREYAASLFQAHGATTKRPEPTDG